jgi:SAM-dependent methyltransferase
MTDAPNVTANTEDFEFAALAQAGNYRSALFTQFRAALHGDVLEVGAGIGQMTEHLRRLPEVRRAIAIEPDARFCAEHRRRLPGHELLEGTVADLPAQTSCDAILSINVLEHIREDEAELGRYAALLRARQGVLCLFVPARPELYAPIDKDFGHFRRYDYRGLKDKLLRAGFAVERMYYFNFAGYFAWWLNFCLLKKRAFSPKMVRVYDRLIFPVTYWIESNILRPPLGQSLLAVARATHSN